MNRQQGSERDRPQRGYRQQGSQRDRYRSQGEQRYFPDDDQYNRRYESGGYQEEFGNYGDRDDIEGPNRQGRDWQAEQSEDFGDNRQSRNWDRDRDTQRYGSVGYGSRQQWSGSTGGSGGGNLPGWLGGQRYGRYEDYSQGGSQDYGQRGSQGQGGSPSYRATLDSGQFWPSTSGSGQAGWTQGQGQSFRGQGPKGYERSDERLKEMICEKLTDDDDIDAREISVEVSEREVTLTGTVPDRQTKFRAEDLVERCGGVKEINNRLRVSRGAGEGGMGESSESGIGASGQSGRKSAGSAATNPKR